MTKAKQYKTTRHIPETNDKKSTDSLSFISCGKNEKTILVVISKLTKPYLNVRQTSMNTGIPRTTLIDILKRLIMKGFIEKPYECAYKLTPKGELYLNTVFNDVGSSRRVCRTGRDNLSVHYTKYILPIADSSKFYADSLYKLNPIEIKELRLPNFVQRICYFSDATVVVGLKTIQIRVHDIIGSDVDDTCFDTFNIALKYIEKFNSLKFVFGPVEVPRGHFSRIESMLSEFISKIDNKYCLDLGEGKIFWIDNSDDHIEDETNDVDVRKRLDTFMTDAINNSTSLISDIDKLRDVVSLLVNYEVVKLKGSSSDFSPGLNLSSRIDYIG